MKRLLLSIFALGACAWAQMNPVISAPGYVQAPGITSVTQVGVAGSTQYCYWVVAQYTGGNSQPTGPVCTLQSNATLSGSNYNVVTYIAPTSPLAAPTNYAILRTTNQIPPTGACACAVATAASGSPQNDQSNSLNAYTVSTFASQYGLQMDAETFAAPVVKPIIGSGFGSPVITAQGGVTGTSSAGAITLNGYQGVITTESLSTAAGSVYTLTLTNSAITSASNVLVQVGYGSSTTGVAILQKVAPANGSVVISVLNLGATSPAGAAFNGTLKVQFSVL